jgi:hypothetical protein
VVAFEFERLMWLCVLRCPQLVHVAPGSKTAHVLSVALGPCPAGRFASGLTAASCVTCPAGRRCPAGSTSAAVCPAGTYSLAASTNCTVCPATVPYSVAGTTAVAGCVACNTSVCGNGTYGTFVCPGSVYTDWSVWYDTAGVEGNNSCYRFVSTPLQFNASRALCAAAGAHLLSSRQVSGCCTLPC